MDSHLFQDTAHPPSCNHPCSSIHQWHHKMQFTRTDRYSHYPRKRQSSIVSRSPAAVTTRRQSSAPDRPRRCQKSSICHGQDPIRSVVCLLASQTITKKPKSRPAWRLPQVLPRPRWSNHIPHRPSGPGNPSPAPATAPVAKQLEGIQAGARMTSHCPRAAQGGFRE